MLATRLPIHVHIPSESETRLLRPGTVIAAVENGWTIRLHEPELPVDAGDDILIFFEHERLFVQQSIRVDVRFDPEEYEAEHGLEALGTPPAEIMVALGLPIGSGSTILGIHTTGDAVSAESRGCHRVSTLFSNLRADVGSRPDCRIVEVSVTGFGAISTDGSHRVGSIVPAVITHDGTEYAGDVCVQSRKPLLEGRCRYGLRCVDDRDRSGSLATGLQKLSMDAQRRQLRRLAGAG